MSVAAQTLGRRRELVLPALQDAVDRLDATTRRVVSYHLGWCDAEGRPEAGDGGKLLRPTLATLSAEAGGGTPEDGVPGAVAVELVHDFSLLHDDLMDGDRRRRHRETVWSLWGGSTAILAGDALLALAQEVLLESGGPHAAAAGALLAASTRDLVRGQVQDLAFESRTSVGLSECLDMAAGKTGSLLSASSAVGAVLVGAPAEVVEALSTFGHQLGVAFQLVDDLLGIWGDPAATGKPVHADLAARKKSLPVTFAMEQGGAAADALRAWMARDAVHERLPQQVHDPAHDRRPDQQHDRQHDQQHARGPDTERGGHDTAEDLSRAADLVEEAGGRRWAREETERRTTLAAQALDSVDVPAAVRDELLDLAEHLVGRSA